MSPSNGKAVTIYDIAKDAGVAPSTVSRALSKPGRVSAATEAKVRASAARLGYQGRTRIPAASNAPEKLILVSVGGVGNQHYQDTLQGLNEEFHKAGYTVAIIDGRAGIDYERPAIEKLVGLAEAMVMISPRIPDAAVVDLAKNRPVVVINRIIRGIRSVIQNVPDGMDQVVEHLKALGHTNVAYFGGPPDSFLQSSRWEALASIAAESSMNVKRIGPFEPNLRGGVKSAEEWLKNPTSAVVAYNDQVALGFMGALSLRGVRVPEDVSVIGIDNDPVGAVSNPPLTSVALAGKGQGVSAAKAVLRALGGEGSGPPIAVIPMRLVVRQTTGPVPEEVVRPIARP